MMPTVFICPRRTMASYCASVIMSAAVKVRSPSVTVAGLAYLTDQFADQMTAGEWSEAFHRFAELSDTFITQARNGAPYDAGNLPTYNLPKKPFNPLLTGLVSLGIGFVIAFLRMNGWKNQLCSVQEKTEAQDYVKKGSLLLTEQKDLFLFRRVERKEKSESNSGGSSTHTSSSGKTHGGAYGKF